MDKRLAGLRMSEHERQRAAYALRDAEAIVDAIVWVKEKIASFGALLLRPGLKH
jgi:hypothetical protein